MASRRTRRPSSGTSGSTGCTPQQAYHIHGELWRIEEGFRVRQQTIAVRPVFDWTQRRVKAHVDIHFALLRILRYRHNTLHGGQEPLSGGRILDELGAVQSLWIKDESTDRHYLLPSGVDNHKRRLYAAVGLKLPERTVQIHPAPSQ